ncbi:MAG: hypothetical protein HUJ99_08200 [Bacteroidaceae bacterium]|nr:hypothetical protein [Bacteroidaceae bacterium]
MANITPIPAKQGQASSVLDGTDLILSIDGGAIAFATGCKVSTSVETGERLTKEKAGGKWKETYVKSFSEQITADSIVMRDGKDGAPSYDELKAKMLSGEPVQAHYGLRDGDERTGKMDGGYVGMYIITQLDVDGPVGEDAKGSITLQNCGAVEKVGNGFNEAED